MGQEKFEGFEDESIKTEGAVQMGTFVNEETLQSDIEQAMSETKDENELKKFIDFCGERPYIVFDKKEMAHFIDLVGYHSRLGYDHYTLSFKLDCTDLEKTGKVTLVYNNGNVMAISEVPVKFSGILTSQIISVDTLLRVFSASKGYLCLFEEESNIFGYVFGGKVYLETFRVETDICSKEYLMDQLSSESKGEKKVTPAFIGTLKMLYDIVKTGSRIEEKAIYFTEEATYIYSGIVMGKFPSLGINITLQDIDISTLAKFFFDVTSDVTVADHDIFIKFSYGGRSVYLAKRGLRLSDDMKYVGLVSKDSVDVSVSAMLSIVSFLIGLPNNTGILNIAPTQGGLSLTCFQKAFDNSSSFKVPGGVSGEGVTEVKIQLDVLKTFMRIFKTNVNLKTNSNKLYVTGQEGDLVIFGNL